MATGVPKTRWNGEIAHGNNGGGKGVEVTLSYQGKRDQEEILRTKTPAVKILWQGSQDAENEMGNRLYYGDNLPILALLTQDQLVRGKIRLIYIDPPFSTRGVFQSRCQTDAYQDLLAGADYVEFIRERLTLLRELLAIDGTIYVHLDSNMVFHIKVIMDEVFGRGNFRSCITRKKCNPKNYTHRAYGNVSDYILFYTRSDNYVWNRPMTKWTSEHSEKEYPYIEEGTGRRYKKVPVHAPGVRYGETGKPWRAMKPPPGKHWQFSPKDLDQMDEKGEIYWSPSGNPRRKIYLDKSPGIPVQDIWLDFRDAHNQMIKVTGYPTEKNPDLLTRLIEASSNPGDLVLDCFSGSGTTLAVASQLGRRWIGIDNSCAAISATLHRFTRGLQRMGDFIKKTEVAKQGELIPNREVIDDFTLYACEPYARDLESVVAEWLKQSERILP